MASTINAIDVTISMTKSGGTTPIVVGCSQAVDITVTRAMNKATCSSSADWEQNSPGRKSWSGSINALLRRFLTAEVATNISYDDVFDMLNDGALVEVEYGTTVTGDIRHHGEAYVSNLKWSKPEDGVVTWSADLTGTGPLTKVTV